MRSLQYAGLVGLSFVATASAVCYQRNGTEMNSNYAPCSLDPSNPMSNVCCASGNTCLPNGVCLEGDTKKPTNEWIFWRESCAKKDWSQGGCQEACSNGRETETYTDIIMTPCDGATNTTSERWCCGASNICCDEKNGIPVIRLAQKFGDPIPSPSSSSSRTSVSASASATQSSPSTSSTGQPGQNPPPLASGSNDGLSTGAKAGIGVGVALGAIALLGIGFLLLKRSRRRSRAAAVTHSELGHNDNGTVHHNDTKVAQLAAPDPVYEMEDGQGHTAPTAAPRT